VEGEQPHVRETGPPPAEPAVPDGGAASAQDAGARAVRGGMLRTAGYGFGFFLGIPTSVLLLHHLGVEGFAQYATVVALLGIVSGITDAGLTAVGARELALRPRGPERDRLLATILGLRLIVTPVGVLFAVVFAIAAGYDDTLVLGTLAGGVGVIAISVQATLLMPLPVELRFGQVTFIDVLRQVLTLAGVALLVALGAGLLPLLAVLAPIGILTLLATIALTWRAGNLRPRFERRLASMLLREALPIAISLTLGVIYLRVLVLLCGFLTTQTETGYFGTSFRAFEVLWSLPTLMLSAALPLLSVAGRDDRARLGGALQTMTEAALIFGLFIAIAVSVGARPLLIALGGDEFSDAAPTLQIQIFAIVLVFVGQAWQLGLVALRRQRALAVANGVALVVVLVAGVTLIPPFGAVGAAIAAVAAEAALAGWVLLSLGRLEPGLVPSMRFAPRVLAIAAVTGIGGALIPDAVLGAVVGSLAFVALMFATRSMPPELMAAFRSRRRVAS
jgi:O-antigen/teichoic acid export membrane protein